MKRSRQPSSQTTEVLLSLAQDPTIWRYGYELCQQIGLKAGSMYPILMRLADSGILETSWESDVPTGRPPRHLYRLTGQGIEMAAQLARSSKHLVNAKRARLRTRAEGAV